MKQTVNFSNFVDAFRNYDRVDNFGYAGLQALFDYLEELEQDVDYEFELDVIGFCCDFALMTLDEINQDYLQGHETLDDAVEWLQEQTTVILVDDETVIVQTF